MNADVFALSADDRLLWPLPIFHSYAHCVCLLSVLTAGASAQLATATHPAELLRTIETSAPTVIAGVPALGPHLMAGYHEQPVAAAMTRGWYRTGDLARRDARGWLMITGRLRSGHRAPRPRLAARRHRRPHVIALRPLP